MIMISVDFINLASYPAPTNYITKGEVLKKYNNLIEIFGKT